MKIGIICSGGDGSGVNACLFNLSKFLHKYKVVFFDHGLEGVINNEISSVTNNDIKKVRNQGGIIIKTSRSSKFLTKKGFELFIGNIKKNNIDLLIILGGNGSFEACKKIIATGIKCVFIPLTIDNDLIYSDYSIGFDTAVNNACNYIKTVHTCMETFDRICIYEVMGRHCPKIANSIAEKIKPCYVYSQESNLEDCLNKTKEFLKTKTSPIIVLQENVIDRNELVKYLKNNIKNCKIKAVEVGYFQRGGNSTKLELKMAKNFAKFVSKNINKGYYNFIVCYKKDLNNMILEQI